MGSRGSAIDKYSRYVAAAYLAFALIVALGDIFYILRHYTPFPFGDHWIWLATLYREGLPAALYQQINEHRMVVPGLLYFLDSRYFGGVNRLLIVVSMLIQAGCVALLVLPLARRRDVPHFLRYVFTGFVAITMFWFIQATNFFYPFSFCMGSSNLGILASLYLFARCCEEPSATRRSTALRVAGIAFFGVWAVLSYGHGILVWLVVLLIGSILRLPKRVLGTILLVFLCVLGFYFFHYITPAGHSRPMETILHHPLKVVHFAVLLMGLPFFGEGVQDIALVDRPATYLLTLCGLLLGAAMLVRFVWAKPAARSKGECFYVSLATLALGSAFITGLSRSTFPMLQALTGRYAPVPLFFWISVVALASIHLSRWEANGGLGRVLWAGLLILASVATFSYQYQMGRYMGIRERGQAVAAMSITVGVPDAPRIGEELANPALVSIVDKAIAQTVGHSLFARPEAALLGTPLLHRFRAAPAGTCLGAVDLLQPLAAPSPRGARLHGWAWDARRKRNVSGIWVVDEQGIIQGIGVMHILRDDVAAAYGNRAMGTTGWTAYSRLPAQGAGALSAYGDLDDGTVCRLGGLPVPQ